eukprot:PhM_4_TR3259/c0_g1_i1/m.70473/K18598/EML6; echinoderm microtubule-associated protein-like 6
MSSTNGNGNIEQQLEAVRAELLRQKIVFESELRRQREHFEERLEDTTRHMRACENDCRNLQTTITLLGRKLDEQRTMIDQMAPNNNHVTSLPATAAHPISAHPIRMPVLPKTSSVSGGSMSMSLARPASPSRMPSPSITRPSTGRANSPLPRRAPSPGGSVMSSAGVVPASRRPPSPVMNPSRSGTPRNVARPTPVRSSIPSSSGMTTRMPPFLANDVVVHSSVAKKQAGSADNANNDVPPYKLDLTRIYGIGSHNYTTAQPFLARGIDSSKLLYSAGSVCVELDTNSASTAFYYGHSESVTCAAVHPGDDERRPGQLVATGQVGRKPFICVWDVETKATVCTLRDFQEKSIVALSFHPSGEYLASVAGDAQHTLMVFHWSSKEVCCSVRVSTETLSSMMFHPMEPRVIVTLSSHSLRFWETTFSGKGHSMKLNPKVGTLPPAAAKRTVGFNGIAFIDAKTTLCGSLEGSLYLWKGTDLATVIEAVHPGGVLCCLDVPKTDVLLTAGADGHVHVWKRTALGTDAGAAFSPLRTIALRDLSASLAPYNVSSLRALTANVVDGGITMYGITNSNVVLQIQMQFAPEDNTVARVLSHSHGRNGTVTALVPHPTTSKMYTLSHNSLAVLDLVFGRLVQSVPLPTTARAMAINPDGTFLCVARDPAAICMYDATTLREEAVHVDGLSDVTVMKFSPDGTHLAVASGKEHAVEVYALEGSAVLRRLGRTRHPGAVMHLDWSSDGEYFQTDDDTKHHLYFTRDCVRVKDPHTTCAALCFEPWTCKYGHSVQGVWQDNMAPDDVASVIATERNDLCFVGDADGSVKVYTYPTVGKLASHRRYKGHGPNVSSVVLNFDRTMLLTTSSDGCVFQWAVKECPVVQN